MNFTVYTRGGCPYCTQVKQILSGKGYTFTEKVLSQDFGRQSFYKQFGSGATFPQVVLDGNNLGGCTDTVKYLREQKLI